jgi:hypothetical protein
MRKSGIPNVVPVQPKQVFEVYDNGIRGSSFSGNETTVYCRPRRLRLFQQVITMALGAIVITLY